MGYSGCVCIYVSYTMNVLASDVMPLPAKAKGYLGQISFARLMAKYLSLLET